MNLSKSDIILIVTSIILLINIYFIIFTDFYKSEINGGSYTLYTMNDSYYINYDSLYIKSELGYINQFNNVKELNKAIESISVQQSTPEAIQDYIDWGIESGYIYTEVYPTIDKQCNIVDPIGEIIIKYSGPDYGNNPEEDIDLQLGIVYDKYDFSLNCGNKIFTMYSLYGSD